MIDADAHVTESHETWTHLAKSEDSFRPQPVEKDGRKFWLIDSQFFPRDTGDKSMGLPICTLEDVPGRLALMDHYGVDTQIIYPTIFQKCQVSQDPETYSALYRSYNRWLAERCAISGGRLRWAMLPPILDMDATVREIAWAKQNGACGIFLRGMEGDRFIDDESYEPMYRAASDADLAICVHAGNANLAFQKLLYPRELFYFVVMPVLASFRRLLTTSVTQKFPDLRFGFIQAGADWVSYLIDDVTRESVITGQKPVSVDELLGEHRLFVSCKPDDDLERILRYGFAESLVVGTDFSHIDTPSELDAHTKIVNQENVLGRDNVMALIDGNARVLHGLPKALSA